MNPKDLDKQYVVQNNNRFDVELSHGKGATCYDIDGKKYIDFSAGIGVNSLGFAPDALVLAVTEQVAKLQHTSNLYYSAPYAELAKLLTSSTGYTRAFFCNSGTEANEALIKLMRKYSFDKYGSGRHVIVTLQGSFHGRTLTALSATGQPAMHTAFQPMTDGFKYIPAGDIKALDTALDKNVAGFIFEPVQGEGGVRTLDAEYVKTAAKLCAERDIAFAADEVQTGIGRTGSLLATDGLGVKPDAVTLAKGLGGGLPIGALLTGDKLSGTFAYGDHGTTFGGNPVVAAGALAVLRAITGDGFLSAVRDKAEYLRGRLKSLVGDKNLSGLGLMIGITLPEGISARGLAERCAARGLLVLTAKEKLRLLPPLNISYPEIDAGFEILKVCIEEKQ